MHRNLIGCKRPYQNRYNGQLCKDFRKGNFKNNTFNKIQGSKEFPQKISPQKRYFSNRIIVFPNFGTPFAITLTEYLAQKLYERKKKNGICKE